MALLAIENRNQNHLFDRNFSWIFFSFSRMIEQNNKFNDIEGLKTASL